MIRWYLARTVDNEMIHDVATNGAPQGSTVETHPCGLSANWCIVRVDVHQGGHDALANAANQTFPITEMMADRANEATHLIARFATLPAARRSAIITRLQALGANTQTIGSTTVRDVVQRVMRRWPRNR